ncbi:MAG: hypothetical protein KJO50_09415, partial [Bacteroidia bacterium]|nr:hypothetical protein [Bacteroidia bacterium]
QWYNKAVFKLNNAEPGSYILTAKVRDDIYGQNIYAEPVYFNIKKSASKNRTLLIIVPLIFLLLFLLSRLVQRI